MGRNVHTEYPTGSASRLGTNDCIPILSWHSGLGLELEFSAPVASGCRQEAQLSQRGCTMIHVIEYFAKSLKIFQMTPLSGAAVSLR